MTTPLTLFLADAHATTISTANLLYDGGAGSPTTTNHQTQVGTATGWGELWSRGTGTSWAAGGSIGAPTGRGFLYDLTALAGQTLQAGTWSQVLRLQSSGTGAVTLTADLHARAFIYNGGTYTALADMVLSAQSITISNANVTVPVVTPSTTMINSGDFLYLDIWCNITSAAGAVSTQQVRLSSLSQDTVGFTGSTTGQLSTPGYGTPAVPVTPTVNPYGAALFSTGDPNTAGNLFSGQNMLSAMLRSGATVARYQIPWNSIERAIQTTSTTAISVAGSATITLATVPAYFVVGAQVLVDVKGTTQETVTITSVAGSTITAVFAKTHTSASYPVAALPLAGDTPASPGSPARVDAYDWSVVDDYVTTCQNNSLACDFVIQNAPTWHLEALAIDGSKTVPKSADTVTFATALLNRYPATTFYALEIGNEGFNTSLLTSGNASTMFSQMSTLLSAVGAVVRSVTPTTLLVAPAELNKNAVNVSAWIAGFFAAGCQSLVDVYTFHYYNNNSGPDQPASGDVSYGQWWQAWHNASVANASVKPIWCTEFGWALLKGTNGGVPDATYAGYISTLLNISYTSNAITRVFVYDLGSLAPGSKLRQDFTKQGYNAWATFIATYPTWLTGPTSPVPTGYYSVFVDGTQHMSVAGLLTVDRTIGKRSTASITLRTTTDTHFQQYQKVSVYDQNAVLAFSGYISAPKEQKIGFANSLIHTLTCIDQHFLADKRVIAASYTNKTVGEIVQSILTNFLAAEGVTAGVIYDGIPPSPTLYPSTTLYPGGNVGLVPQATFVYCTIAAAFDALATEASVAGIPYYWQIDQNKQLFFVPYTAIINPTVVDGTLIDQVGTPAVVQRANPTYRNNQYIVGGVDQTVSQSENRIGDGNTVSWPMGYDLSTAPTITVNGSGKSVGIKGVDTGKDFYWQQGSPDITQDSSATKLTSAQTLAVTYIGQFPTVILAANSAQVGYQAALDGSTGIIEEVEQDATITSATNGFAKAGALLSTYGTQGTQLQFTTLQSGFAPGQLITVALPMHGLNSVQMLIEEVSLSDQTDSFNIWYTITAVLGPFDVTWEDFWSKMLKQQAPANSINVGLSSAIIILASFTAGILLNATLTAVPYACPLPGATLYPSSSLYPC